jgi:S-formylglutathione hydrolase FrmB
MYRNVTGVSVLSRSSSVQVSSTFSLDHLSPASNSFITDEKIWKEYDATELVASYQGRKPHGPVLIDQGTDDPFKDKYMCPDKFAAACKSASFPIDLRMQEGYDHGYYFIMTFLEDHFKYHKKELEQ